MIYTNENVFISLTHDQLDTNSSFKFINQNDCGGNSLFVGTTRGYEYVDGHRVPIKGLYYEAYETMAIKKMIEIVERAMSMNEEIKRCYVVHRLGMIRTGEASIIISTCSKSREDCWKETMDVLCEIKQQVPVFKKIIFLDDEINNRIDESESHKFQVVKVAKDNELKNDHSTDGKIDQSINQLNVQAPSQLQTNWIMKSEAFWLKK